MKTPSMKPTFPYIFAASISAADNNGTVSVYLVTFQSDTLSVEENENFVLEEIAPYYIDIDETAAIDILLERVSTQFIKEAYTSMLQSEPITLAA